MSGILHESAGTDNKTLNLTGVTCNANLWLNFQVDGTIGVNSGNVTLWKDSVSNVNITPDATLRPPILDASVTLNGHSTIKFYCLNPLESRLSDRVYSSLSNILLTLPTNTQKTIITSMLLKFNTHVQQGSNQLKTNIQMGDMVASYPDYDARKNFTLKTAGKYFVLEDTDISDEAWHLVTREVRYDDGDNTRFIWYIDGVLVLSEPVAGASSYSNPTDIFVGAGNPASNPYGMDANCGCVMVFGDTNFTDDDHFNLYEIIKARYGL